MLVFGGVRHSNRGVFLGMFVGAPHIFSGVWMCKGRNHLQSTLIAHLAIISKSAYTPETDCGYPKCICTWYIVFRPQHA